MKNLSTLAAEDFEPYQGQTIELILDDGKQVDLELREVKLRGTFDPEFDTRQTFSVLFRGPMELALPQRIYRLNHEALGELQLFLVPIGPDKIGMCFKAIFN